MTAPDRAERLATQFDPRSGRADIWRGLSLFLDTDSYLNIGYSGRFQSHLFGDPQARLVDLVVDTLAETRAAPAGDQLVDLGCGRGEPLERATDRYDFDGIGVDLIAGNVHAARTSARTRSAFVVGDVSQLPIRDGSIAAAMSIDAIAYVPDRAGVYGELARVLERGGTAVVSDLVLDDDADDRDAIERFGSAWEIPPPDPVSTYLDAITNSGLEVLDVRLLTPHSLATFRKWTTLFLLLADGPTRPAFSRLLRAAGMDPALVVEQVRVAHRALPLLEHVLLVLER